MTRVVYTGTREPPQVPGIELHHLPMLERVALPLPPALVSKLGSDTPGVVVFFSTNAAQRVLDELEPSAFAGAQVWAVGDKTAQWLTETLGQKIHRPARQDFEGLVAELTEAVPPETPIISFELQGSERRLEDELTDRKVTSIPAYETLPCNWDDLDGLLRRIDPRWVIFASPRGYSAFTANLHHRPVGDSYRVAVIGPNTRDHIVARGGRVDLVPESPDVEAILRELSSA